MPRALPAILLLALALRLGWCLTLPTDEPSLRSLPDQLEYLSAGRNLAAGNGLQFTDPRYPIPLYAFRAPGYPLLIAATGGHLTLLRILQSVLDTSTVLAAFLLARQFVPRYALVAAALTALCPYLVYFTGLVLTETLFTALLAWGTYLLLRDTQQQQQRGGQGNLAFLAGLTLLALSVLVRPGAIALPVLLALFAALSRTRPLRFPAPLVAACLTVLVLSPWAYRNHRLLGQWIWTTTNAGVTAYDGFNPAADGSSNQAAFLPHYPELTELTETQRNDYLSRLAATWRSEHPTESLRLAAIKVGRTWSPFPLSHENQSRLTVTAGTIYSAVAWGLALVGLLRGPGRIGLKLTLLLPALYLTLGAAATVGSLRYRLPVEPLLAVLAASGFAFLRSPPPSPRPIPSVSSNFSIDKLSKDPTPDPSPAPTG